MISSTTNSAWIPEAEIDRVGSEPFAYHNIFPVFFITVPAVAWKQTELRTDHTAKQWKSGNPAM